MGYIHAGPDHRAGGWLGAVLGFVQQKLSFHSTTPPYRLSLRYVAIFWPPFVGIAIPWGHRRYATVRAGWRWDNNWPGYIADVIIKLRVAAIPFLVLLTLACGKHPPVVQPTPIREVVIQEVKVPTPTIILPPAELLAPFTMPLPVFVSPSDPNASSALTVEQERALRAWVKERTSRWEAFMAWVMSLMP